MFKRRRKFDRDLDSSSRMQLCYEEHAIYRCAATSVKLLNTYKNNEPKNRNNAYA